MTNWNKHGKIGGTLLENWVEEREIPADMLLLRSNPIEILKKGHKGILEIPGSTLTSDGSFIPLTTTNQDSYSPQFHSSSKNLIGKKKRMVEAALIERAKLACRPTVESGNTKDWISTHHHDYDHSDIYPDIKDLSLLTANTGEMEITDQDLEQYADPITFWSEESKNGKGVTICSIPAPSLESNADAPVNSNGKVKRRLFFKKPDFSTPAREYRGNEVK